MYLFQSTLPRGSDHPRVLLGQPRRNFNSRSLAGATPDGYATPDKSLFQSTLPRGSDHSLHIFVTIADEFQSTLPRGSDAAVIDCKRLEAKISISIHAPSRERHYHEDFVLMYLGISIHAPSRERQPAAAVLTDLPAISIHAPSRERRNMVILLYCRIIFQSTLPRGSDPMIFTYTFCILISIHAPSRERRQGLEEEL